jgi:hypothetical protein
VRSLTRHSSSFNIPHPLDGHTRVPRKGPVAFAAHLRSQRGAKARGIFSFVRHEISLFSPRLRRLKERSTDFRHSFTFSEVSQLAQDTSTVLANICEWRNSFVRVNRIPVDVLSLIPTHLSSQRNRFRASFVCRHWRRTFLHNAALWSQLYLLRGEVYVKTLLERAKGSALDITVNDMDPVRAMALLPPHAKQIRSLDFAYNYWADIQRFSGANSGPLPLLTTLRITAVNEFSLEALDDMTLPSLPLFSNAANLKNFFLCLDGYSSFGHFNFPSLTTFELSVMSEDDFHASRLLNFLEASPLLRMVDMKIIADIVLEGVPQERLVLLPDVETFRLVLSDGGPGYKVAAHISCPSAKHMSLMHDTYTDEVDSSEIFPSSTSWNAIVRQYTRSPVEEVTLETRIGSNLKFSLTFQSPDATVTRLGFEAAATRGYDGDLLELYCKAFSRASRTIRDHPLLANVKRLHFNHSFYLFGCAQRRLIAHEVGQLFKSVGPLEELTFDCCDLRSYLIFLDLPEPYDIEQPVAFPAVKELTILHPVTPRNERTAIIVRLAKSQYALGVPFERVTVRMENLPTAIAEGLGPWVGAVDVCEQVFMGHLLD